MTQAALYRSFRRLAGNLKINDVPDTEIQEVINSALEWLAQKLKYSIRTEALAIALVEDQREYPLTEDVLWLLWVDWNDRRLQPASVFAWDQAAVNWQHAASGTPLEYAVRGRRLILYPPPSDDAVDTDGYLSYSYIAATPGVTAAGALELSRSDQRLALLQASWEWCLTHPSEENAARGQGLLSLRDEMLTDAERAARNPIREYAPRINVKVSRDYPAR